MVDQRVFCCSLKWGRRRSTHGCRKSYINVMSKVVAQARLSTLWGLIALGQRFSNSLVSRPFEKSKKIVCLCGFYMLILLYWKYLKLINANNSSKTYVSELMYPKYSFLFICKFVCKFATQNSCHINNFWIFWHVTQNIWKSGIIENQAEFNKTEIESLTTSSHKFYLETILLIQCL